MEKRYRIVGNRGKWAVAEDDAKPSGNYATREALSKLFIWRRQMILNGVIIRIDPPPPDAPSTGGRA
jgi:hypothetical protein